MNGSVDSKLLMNHIRTLPCHSEMQKLKRLPWLDDKDHLLEMAPDVYFQTDHYVGWPHLPVRAAVIGDAELRLRLIGAWLFRAPKKLATRYQARSQASARWTAGRCSMRA